MREMLAELLLLLRRDGFSQLSSRLFRLGSHYLHAKWSGMPRIFLKRTRHLRSEFRHATLFIDHSLGGGTEFYRNDEIKRLLAQQKRVILLTPMLVNGMQKAFCITFLHPQMSSQHFYCNRAQTIQQFLQELKLQEILCNSLVSFANYPLWLQWLKQLALQIPLTVFVHDFYPVCPGTLLLNSQNRFCALQECEACRPDIRHWRQSWTPVLAAAREIRCFSESSSRILYQAYPGQQEKITVIPHSMTNFHPERSGELALNKLRLGIVGNTNSVGKGSVVLQQVADFLNKRNEKLPFIGHFYDSPPSNLVISGAYQRHELFCKLREYEINVVLFPSVCPETFSFVVSELMLLEIPVLAFDVVAQGEKIRSYRWGRLLSSDDPAIIYREAELLFRDYKSHHTS